MSTVCSLSSAGHSTADATDFGRKYIILKRHLVDYATVFFKDLLPKSMGLLIAHYVVEGEIMDREGWQRHFGVDIGPETVAVQRALAFENFYQIYHRPDPTSSMKEILFKGAETNAFDRGYYSPQEYHANSKLISVSENSDGKLVCETSFVPTVVPERVTWQGAEVDYNLNLLGRLLQQNPTQGHKARYASANTNSLQRHGSTKTRQVLVISLKDCVACNGSWIEQVRYLELLNNRTRYGCLTNPDALKQITTRVADYVTTGVYKSYVTFRTKETIGNCHMAAMWYENSGVTLEIGDDNHEDDKYTGVGVLWVSGE